MTGSDIQDYIETRLGRTVSSDDVLEAINEGLDEIGELGNVYGTIDVSVSDTEQWYSLPADYTNVTKIYKQTDYDDILYNWDYRGGSVNIDKEGDWRIEAEKIPTHLSTIGDSFVDLHRLYHNAIKYYALAWIKENDDPDDPTAQKLYQKFRRKVQRANATTSNSSPPGSFEVDRI